MDILSGIKPEEIKIKSIGEEFVEWAKKGWCLDGAYACFQNYHSEDCPFEIVEPYFVSKINSLIKERLGI